MARDVRIHLRVSDREHDLLQRAAELRAGQEPDTFPHGLDVTTYARVVAVEAASVALGEVAPPARRSRRRKFPTDAA